MHAKWPDTMNSTISIFLCHLLSFSLSSFCVRTFKLHWLKQMESYIGNWIVLIDVHSFYLCSNAIQPLYIIFWQLLQKHRTLFDCLLWFSLDWWIWNFSFVSLVPPRNISTARWIEQMLDPFGFAQFNTNNSHCIYHWHFTRIDTTTSQLNHLFLCRFNRIFLRSYFSLSEFDSINSDALNWKQSTENW